MKHMIALVCTLVLCMGLAACGGAPAAGQEPGSTSVAGSASSSQSAPQENRDPVDLETLAGTWDGSVYTNEWAGVTFPLPDGWMILTNDQILQIMGAGADQMTDALNVDKDAVTASISETDTYCFYIAKADFTGTFFLDAVDRVAGKVPSMTPAQYLQQTGALMQTVGETTLEPIREEKFGGRDASVLTMQTTFADQGVTSQVTYRVVEQGRYLLAYVAMSTTSSSAEEVAALADSFAPTAQP